MPGNTHLPVASTTRGQSVGIEVGGGYRNDVTIADADVAHRRRRAGAVEPPAIA